MKTVLAIAGILVLSALLAARIAGRRKKKPEPLPRPLVGTRRQNFREAGRPEGKKGRGGLRGRAVPVLAALLVALWIGLSLANFGGGENAPALSSPGPSGAETDPVPGDPGDPADDAPSPFISVKIDPPPARVENPLVFEIPKEGNADAEGANAPDQTNAPDGQGSGASPGSADPASPDFSPEPEKEPSPILGNALELSPVISRMEPVGRALDPENPVPKALPAVPPKKDGEEKPGPRLVAPPKREAPPPRPPGAGAAANRRYTIIVGSFTKEENAAKMVRKLESEGLPGEVVPVTNDGQPWFRVMSGVFEDRESAEAYRRELRRKNISDTPYVKVL
ncbi:MAG: SPOR domain-containing protein [Deltaproteobacteria bacterium]|nr:SPOR domain-containing protein [Deltaproteobacteria bacterium]